MEGPFSLHDWVIDPESLTATRDEEAHRLEAKAMAVLVHLKARTPHAVAPDELLDQIWPGVVVVDNVVHRAIGNLRRILGDDPKAPRFIETVPRRGYRLIAPVDEVIPGSTPVEQIPLAVLPLTNLTGDPELDYLGTAIATEIWDQLADSDAFRMISMRSAASFRGSTATIAEIGRSLGVRYLIDGSYRGTADKTRISVHLLDATADGQLWSRQYDVRSQDIANLLSMLAKFSGQMARVLGVEVETKPSSAVPTLNVDAYRLLNQAVAVMQETGNPRKALALADRALVIEPDYGRALISRARYLSYVAEFAQGPTRDYFSNAKEAVLKAMEVAGDSATLYGTLGHLHARLDLDFRAAMDCFRQAERLSSSTLSFSSELQDLLMNAGEYERALIYTRRAEVEEPRSPIPKLHTARQLHRLNRIDEARDKYEEALALAPKNSTVVGDSVRFYIRTGELQRAREVLNASGSSPRHEEWLSARIALAEGDSRPLRAVVDRIANRSPDFWRAARIAQDYYLLGDYAAHIHWTRIREEECDGLAWILDELRWTPDYWERLDAWVLKDLDHAAERQQLVREHRDRIERITRKMVL